MRAAHLPVLLLIAACGGSHVSHNITKFGTPGGQTWSSIGGTSASLVIPPNSVGVSGVTLTCDNHAPEDGTPDEATILGQVFDFGPDGQTFNPAATLTLPVSDPSKNVVISFMHTGDSAWTDLPTTHMGATASVTIAHFTLYAVRVVSGADGGTADAGPVADCTGPILATCAIKMTGGGHTCTEIYGVVESDTPSNCSGAGFTYSTSSTPCSHDNTIGECVGQGPHECNEAYYYSDGLTVAQAKLQCGGSWK